MVRTLHFQDLGSYHRWLAFGHIHHKFHGKAHIMIHGKHHAVVHKSHHEAREIHEERHGRTRTIKINLGRAYGVKIQGATSSRPYKTGKTKVPSNIWRGADRGIVGGTGGMKMGKINIGNIRIRI